jgi:hypothetical protein
LGRRQRLGGRPYPWRPESIRRRCDASRRRSSDYWVGDAGAENIWRRHDACRAEWGKLLMGSAYRRTDARPIDRGMGQPGFATELRRCDARTTHTGGLGRRDRHTGTHERTDAERVASCEWAHPGSRRHAICI